MYLFFSSDYSYCCRRYPFSVLKGASAAVPASVSSGVADSMASSLINKFGKRAADNKFKVCTHVPNTKIKSLFHVTILQVSIQIKRLCNSQLNFGNESQT